MSSSKPQRASRLQRLLDELDDLESLREKLDDARGAAARKRLLTDKRRRREELLALLRDTPPKALADTLLGSDDFSDFDDEEALLLAALLHARIRDAEFALPGRELLWVLADSSFDTFRTAKLLHAEGNLRRSGVVVTLPDPDLDADDVFGQHYMLAPEVFRIICERHFDLKSGAEASAPPTPYADNTDLFLDQVALVELLEMRAAKVFDWPESIVGVSMPTAPIRRWARSSAASSDSPGKGSFATASGPRSAVPMYLSRSG